MTMPNPMLPDNIFVRYARQELRSMKPTHTLKIRQLNHENLTEAAHLVGRAMQDNPSLVRIFAIEAKERRYRTMMRFFKPVLSGLFDRGLILGAFLGDELVGVCGLARPGLCQPTIREKLTILPSLLLEHPIATPWRLLKHVGEWAGRDPVQPHWHLGPMAVAPNRQEHGIGSAMLEEVCAMMNKLRAMMYLETDKADDVVFYEKFGFGVIGDARVLGARNWFMSRSAI